jgi:hypothetical protein
MSRLARAKGHLRRQLTSREGALPAAACPTGNSPCSTRAAADRLDHRTIGQ